MKPEKFMCKVVCKATEKQAAHTKWHKTADAAKEKAHALMKRKGMPEDKYSVEVVKGG